MTCGSGVTACGLKIAAHLIGFENVKVYDGVGVNGVATKIHLLKFNDQ